MDIDAPGTHYPIDVHFWSWGSGQPIRSGAFDGTGN